MTEQYTGKLYKAYYDAWITCPYCGEHKALLKRIGWYFVKCFSCSRTGESAKTKIEAIDNWLEAEGE